MTHQKIGILGGMGPAAGVYFAQKLIDLNTSANHDADHATFILYSDPQVPNRVDAFLNRTISPVTSIVSSLDKLSLLGADFGVIICNTAHIFFDEIAANARLPLINMIENVAGHVTNINRGACIGLLATAATVRSGIYSHAFEAIGRDLVVPTKEDQEIISAAIFDNQYGLKATGTSLSDKAREGITEVANRMRQQTGVQHLLLGCTELSFAIPADSWSGFHIIDPVTILARTCLSRAGLSRDTNDANLLSSVM